MAQDASGQDFPYFASRDSNSITLQRGKEEEAQLENYKILKSFKFTSDRKCSSVVVRAPDGKVYAYVKGSEIAIKAMLHSGQAS